MGNLEPKFKINIELENGDLKINLDGDKVSLLTGISLLARELKENGISEKAIKNAVNSGLMTEEELIKSTNKKINELLNKLFDL